MPPPGRFQRRVPARVGLVGNPSDGFGGAVVAAIADEWAATVSAVRAASGVRITSPGLESAAWSTTGAFTTDVATTGHVTPHRVVTAALQALERHLTNQAAGGSLPPVAVSWTTTIPRSVGLAGSSAIAIGVIESVAACAGRRLDPRVVAAVALEAETTGLGVAAGWQDRIVQAHRRAMLTDAGVMATVDGLPVPTVRILTGFRADAVIGWTSADAEDSGAYHGALRRRASTDQLAGTMSALADLARGAVGGGDGADVGGLAEFVDRSWRERAASMPLRPAHAALVEAVRNAGVPATSPGSGGSVVALPPDDRARKRAVAALLDRGAEVARVVLR